MNGAIKNKLIEFIKDFSSLASPPVLGVISILIFSFSSNLFYLISFFVLNEIVCSIIKYFFYKSRPIEKPYKTWYEKIEASSFPSIHTSRIAVFTSFYYFIFKPEYKIIFILILTVLLVALSRVYLKKHDMVDTIFGAIFGFLLVYFFQMF